MRAQSRLVRLEVVGPDDLAIADGDEGRHPWPGPDPRASSFVVAGAKVKASSADTTSPKMSQMAAKSVSVA
jgi:hypothetical protein